MNDFVIVGAGGLGRELLGWIAQASEGHRERFKVVAFISEENDAGTLCHGVPIIRPDAWEGSPPRFVIAFGNPAEKKRVALTLAARGWQPEIYVHESAVVGLGTRIGAGTMIFPFCRISSDCVIGQHVLVNGGSGIGHDAVVGSYSSLLGAVSVNGKVRAGEGVVFGAGSSVYPGKKVGDWATIGMGSVVVRNVAEKTTVFGNPARRIDVV
jgi:acetyltransferase EpsM